MSERASPRAELPPQSRAELSSESRAKSPAELSPKPRAEPGSELRPGDYARLLAFRSELRAFMRWSEQAAHAADLTPSLHQLLLVVQGHPARPGPTIGEVARELDVRHHSAVELAQRAQAAGLLARRRDREDHRQVHLQLTAAGRLRLEDLTRRHLPRIAQLARALEAVVERVDVG
jgi:DNA-binding MarR family transcriptional regulator